MKQTFSKTIDNRIYSKKSVLETKKAFEKFCTVHAAPEDANRVKLRIITNGLSDQDHKQVVLEFMNYLLDLSVDSLNG